MYIIILPVQKSKRFVNLFHIKTKSSLIGFGQANKNEKITVPLFFKRLTLPDGEAIIKSIKKYRFNLIDKPCI